MATLAYFMNSRICRTFKSIADEGSDQTKMIYETLNCYYDYFEATETAKLELMTKLQELAIRYDDRGNLIVKST